MRVFVAGGTGVIGRRLVPQLVDRGHQVTAATTSAGNLGLLEQLGAECWNSAYGIDDGGGPPRVKDGA